MLASSLGPPSFSMYIEMLEGSEDKATSEYSVHVMLLPKFKDILVSVNIWRPFPVSNSVSNFHFHFRFRLLQLPLKMSGEEDSAGAPVTKAKFSELLTAMNAVKEQTREMKCNLSDERDAADECLVKKMRLDKGVQFKWKGNEKQHQFNELVQDKIEVAQKSLGSAPPAIEKAKEALGEGEELLKDRPKLIRIADRSEYGWATVSEYEEDELADGSDDKKRLYRAEL